MTDDEEVIVISSNDEIGEPQRRLNKKQLVDKMRAEIAAEEDRRIFEILDNLGT